MARITVNPAISEEYYLGIMERDGGICLNFRLKLFENPNCKKLVEPGKKFDKDHLDGNKDHNCCRNIGPFCHSCNEKKYYLQISSSVAIGGIDYTCICCNTPYEFPMITAQAMQRLFDYQRSMKCLSVCVAKQAPVGASVPARAGFGAPVQAGASAAVEVPANGEARQPARQAGSVSLEEMAALGLERVFTNAKTMNCIIPREGEDIRDSDDMEDTKTSSERKSEKNSRKYWLYFLLMVRLGYTVRANIAKYDFARDLSIQPGTIKNSYYPFISKYFETDKRGYFTKERRAEIKEFLEDNEIIYLIGTWRRSGGSKEGLQRYDVWHVFELYAKVLERQPEEVMQLFAKAPIFKEQEQ